MFAADAVPLSKLKPGHRFRFDSDPAVGSPGAAAVLWVVLASGARYDVRIFRGRKSPEHYVACDALKGGLPGSLLVVPVSPGPSYALSLAGKTQWLIKPDLQQPGWRLRLEHSDGTEESLGLFALPHAAALAVAEFRTGQMQWDGLPRYDVQGFANVWARNFHDLGHWARHD